ncbi:glycosyltransferase family 4 protein [Acetatifactor muris]|nr:glycosyltransferase family 4 protein [Acetatifactor muris]MCR2047483.1 glycosyltransferase family 4 protein [Acetatifactor muris]
MEEIIYISLYGLELKMKKIKGIFCHDLPIYKDKNGMYGCTTLTDDVFKRYLNHVDELVVATRVYHLDCTLEDVHQEKITLPNLKFIDIPNLNKPQYLLTRLHRATKMMEVEFKECDLIFIRGGTIADIGVALAKKYNKPYFCECAGIAFEGLWYYSLLGKLIAPFSELHTKKMVRKAAYVAYVTDEYLQKRYPTKGVAANISDVVIEKVEDAVLEKRIEKIKSRRPDEPWIIGTAAGLMTRLKGQQFVIEAMSRLGDRYNIRYELAGTGNPEYLLSVAKKFHVEDRVVIKGEINHNEILSWMDSLDTYIQPSMQEGLPRALMEAMSRACPCIGSTAGGIPELLEPDAIFKRGDILQLTNIMSEFYESNWYDHSRYNYSRVKHFRRDILEEKRKDFIGRYRNYVLNGK